MSQAMPQSHYDCPCMEKCPLHHAMQLIGGKWKVQILCAVANAGAIRYNALRSKLDGISNTVLASALRELERCDIVADVSHLNDESFWNVIKAARRPLAATHSNSRKICNVPRNLTDDQFRCLAQQGGRVGKMFWPLAPILMVPICPMTCRIAVRCPSWHNGCGKHSGSH